MSRWTRSYNFCASWSLLVSSWSCWSLLPPCLMLLLLAPMLWAEPIWDFNKLFSSLRFFTSRSSCANVSYPHNENRYIINASCPHHKNKDVSMYPAHMMKTKMQLVYPAQLCKLTHTKDACTCSIECPYHENMYLEHPAHTMERKIYLLNFLISVFCPYHENKDSNCVSCPYHKNKDSNCVSCPYHENKDANSVSCPYHENKDANSVSCPYHENKDAYNI